ncbi:MAG: NAD(+) diphosphatase [Clostridiaceae bacterium]
MIYNYCPICGGKLILKDCYDEGKVPFCSNDDLFYFDTPKTCVLVAVIKKDKILLLKQSYTFKNAKVLVAGYVKNGENAEESVSREVFEETGLVIEDIEYLGSEPIIHKDIIMLTFKANYKSGDIVKSQEVESANWYNIKTALAEMKEDKIGTKVVEKVMNKYY